MTLKTRQAVALLNIVLGVLVVLDLILPGEVLKVQDLDSIYNTRVKTGGGRRPTYEDRKILLLGDGETYRLGKFPMQEYLKGQKVQVIKGRISKNINEILIVGKNNHSFEQVGLLSNWYWITAVVSSIIVSIIGLRHYSKVVSILLVASTMFMSIFTLIFLFWY